MTRIAPPTKILVFDVETSGLWPSWDSPDPSINPKTGERYQILSIAMIVADWETLEERDRLYVEFKWDGTSIWSEGAERVHGLTKAHLEEVGVDKEEGFCQIIEFILKHFDRFPPNVAGHNVIFDILFLKDLCRQFDFVLNISNRIIDTNTLGMVCWDAHSSDDLFHKVACPERKEHNAMEDVEYTLHSIKMTRMFFKEGLK